MSNKHNSQKVWALLTWLMIATLILSACGKAQAPKTYHVGIVYSSDNFISIADGFKARLTELGYEEGKNIAYDLQRIDPEKNPAPKIVEKFVADKVDLILAFVSNAAVAAQAGTKGTNIPVIFAFSTIEGNNLVNSVSAPGGNVTGVRYPGPELTAKRFEILKQMVPDLKRLYLTYEPNYPTAKYALAALRPVAEAAGVTLVEEHITKVEDIAANLAVRAKADDIGMDAILIMPENLSQAPAGLAAITEFAAAHQVPIAGNTAIQASQGAIFSYAPDLTENGRQAAVLADKIFKGADVATLPVVTPDSQLHLNYKVAQQLGLMVPEGLLKQAVEIIR